MQSIFHTCYLRGIFPENCFKEVPMAGLDGERPEDQCLKRPEGAHGFHLTQLGALIFWGAVAGMVIKVSPMLCPALSLFSHHVRVILIWHVLSVQVSGCTHSLQMLLPGKNKDARRLVEWVEHGTTLWML